MNSEDLAQVGLTNLTLPCSLLAVPGPWVLTPKPTDISSMRTDCPGAGDLPPGLLQPGLSECCSQELFVIHVSLYSIYNCTPHANLYMCVVTFEFVRGPRQNCRGLCKLNVSMFGMFRLLSLKIYKGLLS